MIRRLLVVAFAAGAVACGGGEPAEEQVTTVPEGTVIVVAESLTATLPVAGTVVARRRAEVTTRMMARITSLPVELGARVTQGQVLVRLGADDIASNRAKAEAGVRAADAARDEAARHAARMDTLLALDVVAHVQRDGAHVQLTQAESQLALAMATLREVETAASYASIPAPFSGAIVARFADEGDMAAPGVPILVVEDLGPRDGLLAVPADLAARIEPGMRIRISGIGADPVSAPVRAIAAGADPMTRTVEVRVELPAHWHTGISVTALVPAGTFEGVAIPSGAVIRRGQLTGVRVVTPHGVAIRWVRLGRTLADGGRIHVLSGIAPGDRIVL
ncbi:MAG: efflux RND transporter periplasmic adaptor subunit [Gemmatimonadota bacterium]|nr:efflux RND transporter periplasmic adaptor subunit [Gemmatimonadota bacterium]MDH3368554.1 efflux RND transporter periplasmic adaptor subunit [Gemmatimonadota bacterium]MDH3477684.1 efflux RND transporter periplasmic adaptor subunit [Gemmatimonadota bacterium]MDH3570126.1 efflux RND transporter periplasmic adaptor subunit [Gemmatimonadota bacterium]MDH5548800.1 efflux RND transporter periplasmic adaptor subunit [Gemmatimonadota bacterium]